MGLHHFIRERVIAHHGGTRFTIRQPTVAAVHTATLLFSTEILALWESREQLEMSFSEAVASVVTEATKERAFRVLCLFVDELDSVQEVSLGVLKELARIGSSMLSLELLSETLDLEAASEAAKTDAPDDDEQVSSQELAIAKLVAMTGVPPHEIMDWPHDSFVAIVRALFQYETNLVKSKTDGKTVPYSPLLNLPGTSYSNG